MPIKYDFLIDENGYYLSQNTYSLKYSEENVSEREFYLIFIIFKHSTHFGFLSVYGIVS